MSTLTIPKSTIPIGTFTFQGQTVSIPASSEYARFFFDLARRVGGVSALSNGDLSDNIDALDADAQFSRSDPLAQDAMRAVDELRQTVSSLRNDCDMLRSQIADRDAELAGLRSIPDLRQRVEQLEDRNT